MRAESFLMPNLIEFNSAGELLEVCSLFGELSEELAKKKK